MNQPVFICVSLVDHNVGSDEARAVASELSRETQQRRARFGSTTHTTIVLYVRLRRYKESRNYHSQEAAFTSG